jgi:hypothetical protein
MVVVTQPDREAFLRCRRQWDLQARMPDTLEEGRLGGGAWGMGRGAAPLRRA